MAKLRVVLIALATLVAFYFAMPVQSQGQTVGLLQNDPGSFVGYTFFSPLPSEKAYLIDNNGELVHSWDIGPGLSSYLLEDGSVIHTADIIYNLKYIWGGQTGGVQRYDWDGNLIWEYTYSDLAPGFDYHLHHDLEVLPNGNILMIAWERQTVAEAVAAGRDPDSLEGEMHSLRLIEVEPVGPTGGNIVWEWNAFDHLTQDFDATKDNFGVVADHPELIDVNFSDANLFGEGEPDWLHTNSVEYNPELDQILVSVRHFSEIWVIDHSTTTEEAASHSGGTSGKGGDLLYRWGNPEAYGAGDAGDQQLFVQHDARWIEPGLPGAGNILVFSNGPRPAGDISSVEEIVPPVDGLGNYTLTPGEAYGPATPVWSYSDPGAFYSKLVSSAQRLPNGNTLINEGSSGEFFEVDPSGAIVWRYVNPVGTDGPLTQGDPRPKLGFAVFRVTRYAPDYPGLAGRDLTPGGPLSPARLGDVDCNGVVTSIDAALILQLTAGVVSFLFCPESADVNGDGETTSIDAAIILQFTAGLIPSLPP